MEIYLNAKQNFFIYYKTIIVKYSIFCPVNIFSAFFVCKTCYISTQEIWKYNKRKDI